MSTAEEATEQAFDVLHAIIPELYINHKSPFRDIICVAIFTLNIRIYKDLCELFISQVAPPGLMRYILLPLISQTCAEGTQTIAPISFDWRWQPVLHIEALCESVQVNAPGTDKRSE